LRLRIADTGRVETDLASWPEDDRHPPLRLLLDPRGRISRRTWWLWGVGALVGIGALLHTLLGIARVKSGSAEPFVNLLLLWPALVLSIKRWHDTNRPGGWVLIALIPVVGWAALLVANGFMPGTKGANRYGEGS
jgi:uncharacterized membrane protein YhaH (DUF805 family)